MKFPNYLALMQLIENHCAGYSSAENQIVDKLHGLARVVGIHEEKIIEALNSNKQLVIDEP